MWIVHTDVSLGPSHLSASQVSFVHVSNEGLHGSHLVLILAQVKRTSLPHSRHVLNFKGRGGPAKIHTGIQAHKHESRLARTHARAHTHTHTHTHTSPPFGK